MSRGSTIPKLAKSKVGRQPSSWDILDASPGEKGSFRFSINVLSEIRRACMVNLRPLRTFICFVSMGELALFHQPHEWFSKDKSKAPAPLRKLLEEPSRTPLQDLFPNPGKSRTVWRICRCLRASLRGANNIWVSVDLFHVPVLQAGRSHAKHKP